MAEFSSKAAEKAAADLTAEHLEAIEPTGKDGKITKGDVEKAKAPAGEPKKARSKAEPVERVRSHNQSWTDPFSGEEVLLNGGVPSSGARIVTADGEPVTTRLSEDERYLAVID